MIDLVKPVNPLARVGRERKQNGSRGDRKRDSENRLGRVMGRYGILMWSQGLRWGALNVALAYVAHSNRSR